MILPTDAKNTDKEKSENIRVLLYQWKISFANIFVVVIVFAEEYYTPTPLFCDSARIVL